MKPSHPPIEFMTDTTTAPDDKRRREAADEYVKGMINKSPTAYYGFLEGCAHEAQHQVLRNGGEGIGQVYGLTNCSACKELTNDYRFVGKGYLCPNCFDEFPALLAKLDAEIKQLGENVTTWMKESFKWNKRSQAERARIEKLREALKTINSDAANGDGTSTECHLAYMADEAIAEDDRLKEQG